MTVLGLRSSLLDNNNNNNNNNNNKKNMDEKRREILHDELASRNSSTNYGVFITGL